MTLQIPYSTKINERLTGQSISGESHIVGIIATATYVPGLIRLVEVPQAPAPLSSVSIPGYTEIMSGTPTGTQFLVNYTTGVITFATSQDGNTVSVSYIGLGSEFAAEDVNEIQNPLGTIAAQTIVYNWPAAPTVSWSLSPNIVTSSAIANSAVTGSKIASATITNTNVATGVFSAITGVGTQTQALNMGSNLIDNVTDPVSAQDAATKHYVDTHTTSPGGTSGDIQYNNSGVFAGASNITTDGTNLTLTSGTLNTSAVTASSLLTVTAGSHNWLFTSDGGIVLPNLLSDPSISTGKVVYNSTSNLINWYDGTTWQESASRSYVTTNFLALTGGTLTGALGIGETPVASAILDVASTTQGFLPPRMTSTQRTAISSPAAGLIVYDTTSNQWYGWNGSSWAILG